MSTERDNKRLSAPFPDELPTMVVVQGSFQTPQVYEGFEQSLVDLGYPVVHPILPSCHMPHDAELPKRTLVDDAYSVRRELSRLIEREGMTVSVVMHGYGGIVGSEAILEQFNLKSRQSQGLLGGVIHLFYISACILAQDQSMLSTFEGSLNNDLSHDGLLTIRDAQNTLYNDLPASEASTWASRLIPQSRKVQDGKLTNTAWRNIPSTYLICEKDRAAPPEYQERFAASAQSHVRRCSAGHTPMLSQPGMLAQKVADAL
ncbi:MAG: hypothetical protein Q9191_004509 [Dirinaria sp. TL-2023a]